MPGLAGARIPRGVVSSVLTTLDATRSHQGSRKSGEMSLVIPLVLQRHADTAWISRSAGTSGVEANYIVAPVERAINLGDHAAQSNNMHLARMSPSRSWRPSDSQ
ncbi:hypothetical protein BV22DRAFT_721398 [Leucogyrophana mollusca]|uniref:Uncharacterized protein n=1 Tax=Leucogyrophana mollusca TaxID=85980 RepID=A0ACB8B8R8_9AGAM|nr:hypothetical protein BV22DRAFT_721398 [Leucogyrophana mollusca]